MSATSCGFVGKFAVHHRDKVSTGRVVGLYGRLVERFVVFRVVRNTTAVKQINTSFIKHTNNNLSHPPPPPPQPHLPFQIVSPHPPIQPPPSLRPLNLLLHLFDLPLLHVQVLPPLLHPSLLKVEHNHVPTPDVESAHAADGVEGVVNVVEHDESGALGCLGVTKTDLTDGTIFTKDLVQLLGGYLG